MLNHRHYLTPCQWNLGSLGSKMGENDFHGNLESKVMMTPVQLSTDHENCIVIMNGQAWVMVIFLTDHVCLFFYISSSLWTFVTCVGSCWKGLWGFVCTKMGVNRKQSYNSCVIAVLILLATHSVMFRVKCWEISYTPWFVKTCQY